MERQSFLVGRPDEFARRGITPDAEPIGRLDQDVAFIPDPFDDVAKDLQVAGGTLVFRAGMNVHDRGASLVARVRRIGDFRSEEHTSELQSHSDLVCRLLLEKKKDINKCDSDKYTVC